MSTFIVMAPPEFGDLETDPAEADRIKFVPDRFSYLAFLVSIPWMLFHRMWLVFLGYLGIAVLVELLAQAVGGPAIGVVTATMSLIFGFEAQALRRWSLTKKGWRILGVVEAGCAEDAEFRFFNKLSSQPADTQIGMDQERVRAARVPIIPRIGSEQVVGLTLGPETRQ